MSVRARSRQLVRRTTGSMRKSTWSHSTTVPSMRRNGRPICAGEAERGERGLQRSRPAALAKRARGCGSHRGVPRLRCTRAHKKTSACLSEQASCGNWFERRQRTSGDFSTRLLIVSRRVLRTRGEGRQRPSTTRAFFALARWAASARVGAGESVREVVRRGHVLIVVLELLGRDRLPKIERKGRNNVVLGRGERLRLRDFASTELSGHFF